MTAVSSDLLAVAGIVVGVVLTVVVTVIFARKSYTATEESALVLAAAEIKGLAQTIIDSHARIAQVESALDTIGREIESFSGPIEPGSAAYLAPGLNRRMGEAVPEKRALGRYLRHFVRPGAVVAIDCGTVTGWIYYELFHDGPILGKVITNNLFVAAMTENRELGQRLDLDQHSMLTDENPSPCHFVGGRYFPGYGATLTSEPSELETSREILRSSDLDLVLVGTTSLQVRTGPRGRSLENRLFKEMLIEEACRSDDTLLVVALESYKVGLALGDPCDAELWRVALTRSNTWILIGGIPDQGAGDVAARLLEEGNVLTQLRKDSECRAQFLVVDSEGSLSSRFSLRRATGD